MGNSTLPCEALRKAVERPPQVLPGLLAWVEHALRWELDRRKSTITGSPRPWKRLRESAKIIDEQSDNVKRDEAVAIDAMHAFKD